MAGCEKGGGKDDNSVADRKRRDRRAGGQNNCGRIADRDEGKLGRQRIKALMESC